MSNKNSKAASHSESDSSKVSESKESKVEEKAGRVLHNGVAKEGFENLNARVKHDADQIKEDKSKSVERNIREKGRSGVTPYTIEQGGSPTITDKGKVIVQGRSKEDVAKAVQHMQAESDKGLLMGAGGKFKGADHLLAQKPADAGAEHKTKPGDKSATPNSAHSNDKAVHSNDKAAHLTDKAAHSNDKTAHANDKSANPNDKTAQLNDKAVPRVLSDASNTWKVTYDKEGHPAQVDYPDHSSRKFHYKGSELTRMDHTPAPNSKDAPTSFQKNSDGTWAHVDKTGKPLSPESAKLNYKIEVAKDGAFTRSEPNKVSLFSDKSGFDYDYKRDVQDTMRPDGTIVSKNLPVGDTWISKGNHLEVHVPQNGGSVKVYDLQKGDSVTKDASGKEIAHHNQRETQQELAKTGDLGYKILRFMEPNVRVDLSDGKNATVEQKIGQSVVRLAGPGKSTVERPKFSGWVATTDGKIATAAHEALQEPHCKMYYQDKNGEWKNTSVDLVKVDPENDVAIYELRDKSRIPFLNSTLKDNSGQPAEGRIQAVGTPAEAATFRQGDKELSKSREGVPGITETVFQLKEAKGRITGHDSEATLEARQTKLLAEQEKKTLADLTASQQKEKLLSDTVKTTGNDSNRTEASAIQANADAQLLDLSKASAAQKAAAHKKADEARKAADEAKAKHDKAKQDLLAAQTDSAQKKQAADRVAESSANQTKGYGQGTRYEANYDNQKGMSGGPVYANGKVIGMTRGMVFRGAADNANTPNADIVVPVSHVERVLADTTGKYNYTGRENKKVPNPSMTSQDLDRFSR
ncbi:MAG: serine protease [Candidatus Obscuribacterales bacterium]|jgi:hypothetical protein|nr:serine protease [Candidatus Obscuribacterales bacterium]